MLALADPAGDSGDRLLSRGREDSQQFENGELKLKQGAKRPQIGPALAW
jgi:hypothetical protein